MFDQFHRQNSILKLKTMTNFDNIQDQFLDDYEKQARIFKLLISKDATGKSAQYTDLNNQYGQNLLNSVLNFQTIVTSCFVDRAYEEVLKTIEDAQKIELRELYRVKTLNDLKQYRNKILAEQN